MRLGLIGNPLGHSWSPEIHKFCIGEDYSLWQLEENELEDFLAKRDFDGINVTIPYKTAVIRYLDDIDSDAKKLNAVNCIVNDSGKLIGYNTDMPAIVKLFEDNNINAEAGRAAILGTGGVSKAALEACRRMGWECQTVSRTGKDSALTYEELYSCSEGITLLINATPVGMYPDIDNTPADITRFSDLRYTLDLIANPVQTRFTREASRHGIRAYGGLDILCIQALLADIHFTGRDLDIALAYKCRDHLLKEHGM